MKSTVLLFTVPWTPRLAGMFVGSMYHEEQNRDYTKANVNVTSGNSTKLTKGDSKDISHVTTSSGRIP